MIFILKLAIRSALNRKLTLFLIVLSIAFSVTLLIGVDRLRDQAHDGFSHSVSGTDLIIGARMSPVQLLLYSVFRIGEATNNISWSNYKKIATNPLVSWSIPISLGDSHHGYPVLGTTNDYFVFYKYGDQQNLTFKHGKPFSEIFEAVIGSEVAHKLGYEVGKKIVLSHGVGLQNLSEHKDKSFTIVGILKPTGTPVDRTVHVRLEGISAIHLDWVGGAPIHGFNIPKQFVNKFDLTPKEITSALIGLKNRASVFKMQRIVNDFNGEPLLAVLPGIALEQLWEVVAIAEKSLFAVSAMVIAVSMCGLAAVFLAGLNERRRELAILRSVGAQPSEILFLLIIEGMMVSLLGIMIGMLMLSVATIYLAPIVQEKFGIFATFRLVSHHELYLLSIILGIGLLASVIPAFRAYKLSLTDGLIPRI